MKKNNSIKLHLACGPNIVEGWQNVDIKKGKGVINHDLRKPLPYKDNSVEAIYHEHFIEHISKTEGERFLKECNRVLMPGGAMRIAWPDLKKLLNAYFFKNRNYLNYVLPYLEDHRFGNDWDEVISDCIFDWEHRYAYTAKHLMKVLRDSGFTRVKAMPYKKSDHGIALDFRKDPSSSYVEAVK